MAYEVEIFGQAYSLRTDAEEEHVRRVADLLDLKMREVASGTRSVSTLQIAVLAALDIASEYMHTEARAERLVAEVEARADAMARRIASASP
jgi:cell division protein ZapA